MFFTRFSFSFSVVFFSGKRDINATWQEYKFVPIILFSLGFLVLIFKSYWNWNAKIFFKKNIISVLPTYTHTPSTFRKYHNFLLYFLVVMVIWRMYGVRGFSMGLLIAGVMFAFFFILLKVCEPLPSFLKVHLFQQQRHQKAKPKETKNYVKGSCSCEFN